MKENLLIAALAVAIMFVVAVCITPPKGNPCEVLVGYPQVIAGAPGVITTVVDQDSIRVRYVGVEGTYVVPCTAVQR